jgi:cation:H+ antiporter
MVVDVAGLLVSLVVLTVAGDVFVIGVARVAEALKMRPTVVGALVGGVGTSVPVLIVSAIATVQRAPQIALGNLVGSIIVNVSLGLAIASLVAPVRVDSRTVRREAPISVSSVLLFAVFVRMGIHGAEAIAAAAALLVALGMLLLGARPNLDHDELGEEAVEFFGHPERAGPRRDVVRTALSLLAMLGGAELLVRSATALATRAGLAQGFVGLTIVAIGTSAPLIASGIAAARRGDHDLVVGNVLGGNLFIGLLGTVVVGTLGGASGAGFPAISLVVMVAVAAASWGFMARGRRLVRWEALLLLLVYLAMLPFLAP